MGIYRIIITGIVQGVGFRPFIYRLAARFGLKGSIANRGNLGVELIVSDKEAHIPVTVTMKEYGGVTVESVGDISPIMQYFINALYIEKPAISYIEKIRIEPYEENLPTDYFSELRILKSSKGIGPGLTLPPDVAVCKYCLEDMRNPKLKRYYGYPFIACAQCGPRFTTVIELPYDRERTTMAEFPLCHNDPLHPEEGSCYEEYTDFNNRRFHAQTFSCNRCGPNYFLIAGRNISNGDFNGLSADIPKYLYIKDVGKVLKDRRYIKKYADFSIRAAARLIDRGHIVAVMGIGGVHLVCKATDGEVITELRRRKRKRKFKPFAVMLPDIETALNYVKIGETERKLLESHRRPIVLCDKREDCPLPDNIAPGLPNIGIMLPYAGVHYLLFDHLGNIPLVYTSGNISNLPMAITPEEVIRDLNGIADAFLLHNRRIYQRCDDSVIRITERDIKPIRRSRGYVPEYIPLPFKTNVTGGIAVGAELNLTGAVSRGYRIFPTQHIGNVDNPETYSFLENAILHMKRLLALNDGDIKFIVRDLHPSFYTGNLAEDLRERFAQRNGESAKIIKVQHHFAHALSLMVDNGLKEDTEAIICTLDGVGYGSDGNVWGAEILKCGYDGYGRAASFAYVPMIGGDLCVEYPARMLFGFMAESFDFDEIVSIFGKLGIIRGLKHGETELNTLFGMYKSNLNTVLTDSAGRFLDSVSALLGVCFLKTYRGEPAMRLEGCAFGGDPKAYDLTGSFKISASRIDKRIIIDQRPVITKIIEIISENRRSVVRADIAASVQYSLGKVFGRTALELCRKYGIKYTGITGGVAYNGLVWRGFKEAVKEADDIKLLRSFGVPPGDAGISIGQVAAAVYMMEKNII